MFQSVRLSLNIDDGFPIPNYLSFDPVSIDISSKKIRVMKLKNSHGNSLPEIYKEIEIDKKCDIINISKTKDINSEEAKILVETLSKLKKELKLKFVAVALPEIETYIYKIQLPKEALKNIYSAVQFSIEENVPLSMVDAVFDYSILDDEELLKKGKIDIVVMVFPKNVISVYTTILNQAGLFPVCFQSESIASAAAVIKSGDKDPYLLIRLLDDRTNVAIVERNTVQYSSSVSVGMNEIISNQNGDKATELKNALNKLLVFWFTNRNFGEEHKKIKTAYIIGENSSSQEIDEFLERHLKINVETGNVWSNCFDINEFVPKINKNDSLNYAVAIGLALSLKKND